MKQGTDEAGHIWQIVLDEAERDSGNEPLLVDVLHARVLKYPSLEQAVSSGIAEKLATSPLPESHLERVIREVVQTDPYVLHAICADLKAVRKRDRACSTYYRPFFFQGFLGLQACRIAHALYTQGRDALAYFLQSRIAEAFNMDIHPAAQFGVGVVIDHGMGIVIGETALIGDGVFMFHHITLGSTGKEPGDRHPKVGSGVLLGAGATVLGNIEIGNDAIIAAGSVVVEAVPAGSVVGGVPARVIGKAGQIQNG